jgi:hypothetical protein
MKLRGWKKGVVACLQVLSRRSEASTEKLHAKTSVKTAGAFFNT